MQTFFSIVLSLIFAWGCSHHARLRGRNPTTWFFAGALFGLLAVIALFILKKRSSDPLPEVVGKLATKGGPSLEPLFPTHADKYWYFLDTEKTQFGPMSFDGLSRAWHEGTVTETTFVWNEEMENWQHFKEVILNNPA